MRRTVGNRPSTFSWEEYRVEKTEILSELEEVHLMVKLTLDRAVERSSARRNSAFRSDTRHFSAIPETMERPELRPESSRNGQSQLQQTNSELRNMPTVTRELEESFDQYGTVGSRMASGNSGSGPSQVVPTFDVRLDKGHFKLTLPIFSGQHWEWDRFWSQYVLHIDSQGYPDSVKLNILRSHLTGEALDILDTGSQDGTDLEGGKRALKFHYDNEAVKKAAILARLDSIPRATNTSASLSRTFADLRKLIGSLQRYEETNTAHMRRVIRLKLPRVAAVVLKEREDVAGREWSTEELLRALELYISTRRLDETHEDFEKVNSSVNALLSADDNIVVDVKRGSNKSLGTVNKSNVAVTKTNTSSNLSNCVLCGYQNHKADYCRKITVDETESLVRQNRWCRQCFTPGHRAAQCPADPCRNCSGSHNLKLCPLNSGGARQAGGNQQSAGQSASSPVNSSSGNWKQGKGLNYNGNGKGRNWHQGKFQNNSQNQARGQDSFRVPEGN